MFKRKRKIKIKFLFVCLIFFSFIVFLNTYNEQSELLGKKNKDLKIIKNEIKEEKQYSEKLLEEKKSLNTNEMIEKMARAKLGMVRPGEKVFVDRNNGNK